MAGLMIIIVIAFTATTSLRDSFVERINSFGDLEGRHVALVQYFDLDERLIPRHWEVFKKEE